jgi:peroxiredoxin
MGKAARLKQQRPVRAPRTPVAARSAQARRTWLVWAGTGVLVLAIAGAVGGMLASRPSPKAPPSAAAPAADRDAPASLVRAADAVGFHPTTEPGVGEVEGLPASAARSPANPTLLPTGTRAPSFALRTPIGKRVELAGLRGGPVLLEFFATWCPHCNAEAPHLRDLYASLRSRGIAFLSINADGETAPSVFAFHRYFGLPFPALLDPDGQPGSFASPGGPGRVTSAYRVEAFPTFYVIDSNGRISWRSDGEQPDALLRTELLKAAGG